MLNYGGFSNQNVSGDVAVGEGNQVLYRGTDGKMHTYYWTTTSWIHDWIEASWQAPSIHNVSGSIDMGSSNQTFYRGKDGRCRIYHWEEGFFRSSAAGSNYTMYETEPSPTILGSLLTKEFNLLVSPNPTIGEIRIKFFGKDENTFYISLFDVTGKLQMTSVVNSNEDFLNLQGLPSGIYILKAQDSKGNVVTEKVVKQ